MQQGNGLMKERQLAGVVYSRFRLTPAEARIAAGIVRGKTLASIAKARGIAVETVRTQLKSIFKKTRTHRQAQLVALLVRLEQSRGI
jgi:DNA-binding CsgD family transcriptional regulator